MNAKKIDKLPAVDSGFIDMHSHILHGVDDGSTSIEQSKSMLSIAYKENIRIICATPHYGNGNAKSLSCLNEKIAELRVAAAEVAPELEIVPGNELYYSEDAVEALKKGRCSTLAGGDYVLVEFHPAQVYQEIRQGLHRLQAEGFRPVLAHIERYRCLRDKGERLDDLMKMGVYTQINASSVGKSADSGTRRFVKRVFRYGQVNLIATDTHNDCDRPPVLRNCVEYITAKYGRAYCDRLLRDNPMRILLSENI